MWFVMMLFIYGVKATWLLWVWPLFNVIFRMMYLGTWVRRSNVLTGAEWMRTRFGDSRGAELAYLSVVAYALVSMIGFLSYAFRGVATFTAPLFPWHLPDEAYGTAMLLITGVYCIVGGMYSVVMNDLIQFVLKVVAAMAVAVIAIVLIRPEQIMAAVPTGWDNLFFGWKLDLDWSAYARIERSDLHPLRSGGRGRRRLLVIHVVHRDAAAEGRAREHGRPDAELRHPAHSFHAQPSRGGVENMVMAIVSLAPRFLLIAAIAVLGLVFYSPDLAEMGRDVTSRRSCPRCFSDYVPIGLKGILVRRSDRFVHEHVRLHGEFGGGVRRQRHLQAVHQSPCTGEAIRRRRLDHLERP